MRLMARDLSGYWSPEFVETFMRQTGVAGPIKRRMGVPPLRDKETAEAYCMTSLTAGNNYVGMIVQFAAVPGSGDAVKWLAVWDEEATDNAPDVRSRTRSARSLS